MEQHRKELESERLGHSRLFVIDVGNNESELRRRYPDRAHYILADALVLLNLRRSWDEKTKTLKEATLEGYVSEILVSSIHVPLEKRPVLEAIRREREKAAQEKLWGPYGTYGALTAPPSYEVTLAYGRRLEPWIEAIRRIGD